MKFCSFRDPPAAIVVDGVNHSFWCNSGNTSFPIFKLLLLSFMFTYYLARCINGKLYLINYCCDIFSSLSNYSWYE